MTWKIFDVFSHLAENIFGIDAWWCFTACFLVVKLTGVLNWIFCRYLFRAVSEQAWANLMLKRNMLHTKTMQNPYFVFHYVSSLIPWFNSRRNSREGREEWEGLEFDRLKNHWTRPDFSCQALAEGLKENSTLTNLNLERNSIRPEGAKAWCLVRMVWRTGKRAAGFQSKVQDKATWKWSQ